MDGDVFRYSEATFRFVAQRALYIGVRSSNPNPGEIDNGNHKENSDRQHPFQEVNQEVDHKGTEDYKRT